MQQGMTVDEKWIQYQRRQAKHSTLLHIAGTHRDRLPTREEEIERLKLKLLAEAQVKRVKDGAFTQSRSPATVASQNAQNEQLQSRKRNADSMLDGISGFPSTKAHDSSTSLSTTGSKGMPVAKIEPGRSRKSGKLWDPDRDSPTSNTVVGPLGIGTSPRPRINQMRSNPQVPFQSHSTVDPREPVATRPISQDQLVAEVKGVYAGLVMVEAKCIEIDKKQAALSKPDPSIQPKLNDEQWKALIELHRTLLHEHHDFFSASQHPSASPALRGLASKYAMPARMWRHGIHSFLELLRHRLPGSLDHMLFFIYLAYSMMALLYETHPEFEDTWIEALGDLGRYRIAIEDDDIKDRESWTGVARYQSLKALNRALAITRPYATQQRSYYKTLYAKVPLAPARESITELLEPISNKENDQRSTLLSPIEFAFIRTCGRSFTKSHIEGLRDANSERFIRNLIEPDPYTAKETVGHDTYFSESISLDRNGGPPNNGYSSCMNIKEYLSLFNCYICAISYAVERILERLARLLQRKSRKSIAIMAVALGNVSAANALPLTRDSSSSEEDISGFVQYWRNLLNQFGDHYSGPLVMNALWATFLTGSYFVIADCDKRKWRDTDLLAIVLWCTSGPSFFLGMGDWLSDWQLALMWFFSINLTRRFLARKLSELPKSRELTSFFIIMIGFLSAGMLTQFMDVKNGRYTNSWISTAMLSPLMTLCFTHSWSVLLESTGVAQALEDGRYNGLTTRIWQQIAVGFKLVLIAIISFITLRLIMV
ncbi:hypothetical protein F5884DRAFT_56695 [Xylogone sp. PMI_703]|nr:hypothetical protein F5884DRAFT_56695 [Xylogone sp. PMI_703]